MSDEIRREIRRETRWLRAYATALTIAFAAMSLAAFTGQPSQKTRFTEIDVERINVVEPNGHLRMVISNRPRSIGPIYKGKPFGYAGGGRPGIIFFNDEGTENGGLTFTGGRDAQGRYRASAGFSFDQFDQDQILYFQYVDNNGQRRTGLTIADRAEVNIYDFVLQRDSIMKIADTAARRLAMERLSAPRNGVPLSATRVYVGRDVSKNALVNLADPQGKTRIRLRVDSLGRASLDFLDEQGRVTYSLPDTARR